MHSSRTWFLCFLPLLLLGISACAEEVEESNGSRVVAIGDLHADIDAAQRAFQLAGAADEEGNWIGGDLVVVQLGDAIGRSYQDREVLDYIMALREKAAAGGGRVQPLIGNHELFGTRIRLRNVDERAFEAFNDIPGLDLDDPKLADVPLHQRARSAALMPGGFYARQWAGNPVILRLGDTIFVHGGVTPHWAEYGIDKINDEVSRRFRGESDEPLSARGVDSGNFDDSVLFSRRFSQDVDDESCAMLDESLRILDAKRMVVAHTVHDTITAYCDEKVWAIDVGMSRFYGGPTEVLEIVDDEKVSVIRE